MTVILVLLCLPLLAAAVLVVQPPPRIADWLDVGTAAVVLAVAASLPWQARADLGPLRLDPLTSFLALLIALGALATRVGGKRVRPTARIAGQIMLGGMLLAAVSGDRLLTWFAFSLATAAGLARDLPAGWFRVPLSGAALGLALFGGIAPPSMLAAGCVLIGFAALTAAVPELLVILPVVALRYATSAGGELIAAGLAGVLVCAAGLLSPVRERNRPLLVGLGQSGVAATMFGLGSGDGVLAGLILLVLLVLSQAACSLAREDGPARVLASAGLAGLPPIGVFPGLVLAMLATARQMPWLLAPLLAGLSVMVWSVITRLPAVRLAQQPLTASLSEVSPAWIPLALALWVGFFLPATVLDWLRAVAAVVR